LRKKLHLLRFTFPYLFLFRHVLNEGLLLQLLIGKILRLDSLLPNQDLGSALWLPGGRGLLEGVHLVHLELLLLLRHLQRVGQVELQHLAHQNPELPLQVCLQVLLVLVDVQVLAGQDAGLQVLVVLLKIAHVGVQLLRDF